MASNGAGNTLSMSWRAPGRGNAPVLSAAALAGPASQAQAAVGAAADGTGPVLLAALLALLVVLVASVTWLAWRERLGAERLRQANAQLHKLGNLLDVWLWRSDAEHRIVRLRPPAGAAHSQWSQGALGKPLWEQFPSRIEAALRAQLDAHATLENVEVDVAPHGSAPRPASLRATALSNAQGRFAGYLGTVRELPLPAAVAAPDPPAPDADPVATDTPSSDSADESFAYTISHDLRAPIRVVEGFTRILKEDYGPALDRIGIDHLDRVLGAAARMSNMIDALLELSKLSAQPLERQPVNLSQLAAYVAEDLRRLAPQRQVALHIEPDLQVQGDPTLLRMVIENLLGNAWKYTGKRDDGQIWLERNPLEPQSVFTVRDNGAGFDMRFADRLFGAFQRLHSASEFQGTGVGLASVRRIVRRHGGEIWAQAEPGRGASFHFSLAPRSGEGRHWPSGSIQTAPLTRGVAQVQD